MATPTSPSSPSLSSGTPTLSTTTMPTSAHSPSTPTPSTPMSSPRIGFPQHRKERDTSDGGTTPQLIRRKSIRERMGVPNIPHEEPSSAIAGDFCRIFGVFFAIGVRLVLIIFCLFTVWLVTINLGSEYYWLLAVATVPIVIEGIHIICSRAGQERKWFCACFFFYLLAGVPSIWFLELNNLDIYVSQTGKANVTDMVLNVGGLKAEFALDQDMALAVTEQGLLFLLIAGRWLLPRGEITRDQLSQLLFVFIGMASDVMELFQLFAETQVREDPILPYVILTVWTVSLFQFTFVLTMSYNPKKKRVAMRRDEEPEQKQENIFLVLIKTEIWSLIVTFFMQDGPFLVVRLFALVWHNLVNYSIIFFTCKNILVICLLMYRLLVLCLQRCENSDDDDDEDKDEKDVGSPPHRGGSLLREVVYYPLDPAPKGKIVLHRKNVTEGPKTPKLEPKTKDPDENVQENESLEKTPESYGNDPLLATQETL